MSSWGIGMAIDPSETVEHMSSARVHTAQAWCAIARDECTPGQSPAHGHAGAAMRASARCALSARRDAITERELAVPIPEPGGWNHALGSNRHRRHRPSGPDGPGSRGIGFP